MSKISKNIIEIFGWYGAVAILLAYALISFKIITATGYVYQTLNLTGAIGIIVNSLIKKDFQPAILNIVWAIIALIAMASLIITANIPV